jgi:hypothetical protein
MKFNNNIEIKNIRNVQLMPDGAYCATVDLKTNEHDFQEVFYVARNGDCAETGIWVYSQIIDGNFEGSITEWAPPVLSFEKKAAEVRHQRDERLWKTDWTQYFDIPQTTKDKWAPYRQALRDVPSQEGFPYNVVWPNEPA